MKSKKKYTFPQIKPTNPLDGVMLQIYPGAFTEQGTLTEIADKVSYLDDLGITMLMIAGPPLEYEGSDGPYCPLVNLNELPKVDARLGGNAAFQRTLDLLGKSNIKVILDLVLNHMSEASPLWKEVLGDKDARDRECVRLIQNPEPGWFSQPNLFGGQPMLPVPELGPDWFRRVTFYSDQIDLNGASSAVRQYMANVLKMYRRKWGVWAARLDAAGHVGGLTLETEDGIMTPTGFDFIRHLRKEVPEMPLLPEVSGDRTLVARFLQSGLCTFGYDLAYAGYALLAILREDFSVLRDYLNTPVNVDPEARYCYTMGVHDDVNLNLLPRDLRDEAADGLGNGGRFELFGRRALNQRLGMMTPDLAAHHMLLGLMMCLRGTPVLYQGDAEWRQGNVHAVERGPRRDKMLWEPQQSMRSGYGSDSLLPGVSIAEQMVNSRSPLNLCRRLIALRNTSSALQHGDFSLVNTWDPTVYAFQRSAEDQTLIILANPSRFGKELVLDLSPWAGKELLKLGPHYGLGGNPLKWIKVAGVKGGGSYKLLLDAHSLTILRPF